MLFMNERTWEPRRDPFSLFFFYPGLPSALVFPTARSFLAGAGSPKSSTRALLVIEFTILLRPYNLSITLFGRYTTC